jgi:hypothetical protein
MGPQPRQPQQQQLLGPPQCAWLLSRETITRLVGGRGLVVRRGFVRVFGDADLTYSWIGSTQLCWFY